MSEVFSGAIPSEVHPDPWQPSGQLRKHLLVGAIAAVVGSAISATATVWELIQGEQDGFTWALALELAAIFPQMFVLTAFFELAREIDSTGLKRSSVGFFVSGWLLQILLLADESIAPGPWFVILVAVIVVVGTILLVCYAFGAFDSEKLNNTPLLATLAILIIGRRTLGERTRHITLLVVGIALLLIVFAFVVWFAVSLIRLRGKIGGLAAVLGGWMITGLIVFVAALAWAAMAVLDAPIDRLGLLEDTASFHYRMLLLGGLVMTLITAVLCAALFLSLLRRTGPHALGA